MSFPVGRDKAFRWEVMNFLGGKEQAKMAISQNPICPEVFWFWAQNVLEA